MAKNKKKGNIPFCDIFLMLLVIVWDKCWNLLLESSNDTPPWYELSILRKKNKLNTVGHYIVLLITKGEKDTNEKIFEHTDSIM